MERVYRSEPIKKVVMRRTLERGTGIASDGKRIIQPFDFTI